jgi:hypothetical protein
MANSAYDSDEVTRYCFCFTKKKRNSSYSTQVNRLDESDVRGKNSKFNDKITVPQFVALPDRRSTVDPNVSTTSITTISAPIEINDHQSPEEKLSEADKSKNNDDVPDAATRPHNTLAVTTASPAAKSTNTKCSETSQSHLSSRRSEAQKNFDQAVEALQKAIQIDGDMQQPRRAITLIDSSIEEAAKNIDAEIESLIKIRSKVNKREGILVDIKNGFQTALPALTAGLKMAEVCPVSRACFLFN